MKLSRIQRHAPRERVSWNTHPLWLEKNIQWSRSTWACELKYIYKEKYGDSGRHAPRERVSWNLPVLPSFWALIVTLHVSVWVEMLFWGAKKHFWLVTLHVSVWVEMLSSLSVLNLPMSRSTWACELKCCNVQQQGYRQDVTLHVSVWVEILFLWATYGAERVTLHVSVWVEIWITFLLKKIMPSRSTWACELKLNC